MLPAEGNLRHLKPPTRPSKVASETNREKARGPSAYEAYNDDDATIRFVKKVLCKPKVPVGGPTTIPDTESETLEGLLPPLTSSNKVDVELYAIIAVIIHQFVQSWYNLITPDQDFVAEITRIIAHCTRELEQRLRRIELEEVIFDELPALIAAHVDVVRIAKSGRVGLGQTNNNTHAIYHSINPHPAMSPIPKNASALALQQDNQVAWSQLLVSRILPLLLPPEDLENPCLHVLVSEVLAEMIVHGAICEKASQPWLLWEGVTQVIAVLRPGLAPSVSNIETSSIQPINRLEHFGLMSSDAINEQDEGQLRHRAGRFDSIGRMFLLSIQYVVAMWSFLRWLITALAQAPSRPARPNASEKRPVACFGLWTCFSRLASLEQRMPWTVGMLSLLQHAALHGPARVGRAGSALDRLVSSELSRRILRPDLLPAGLRSLRAALFPNNALGPARVPPATTAEVNAIRGACARVVVDAVPDVVRRPFFATGDYGVMCADVERTLLDFDDAYLNKHLIIGVVELIVVRLFPELTENEVR